MVMRCGMWMVILLALVSLGWLGLWWIRR